jgi:hypothetical protein
MKSNLRNFSEKMPPDGVCGLCGLLDEKCSCVKYNCKCNIFALECVWPECTCLKCLEIDKNCKCKNEE